MHKQRTVAECKSNRYKREERTRERSARLEERTEDRLVLANEIISHHHTDKVYVIDETEI